MLIIREFCVNACSNSLHINGFHSLIKITGMGGTGEEPVINTTILNLEYSSCSRGG